MQGDNTFDIQDTIGYNSNQDDVNDFVVKMDEQAPVNDISCEHKEMIPNPDDRIGNAIYYGCANQKCGRGFYLQR